MKTEMIVALDVETAEQAVSTARMLSPEVQFFKVGLELFTAAGHRVLPEITAMKKSIFLDLKLHDIPRTVARSVAAASRLNVQLMTLHAGGGRAMLTEAANAVRDLGPDRPSLLAVTVLTSLERKDLEEVGVNASVSDQALRLAALALECGIDGLVCSVHEASAFRARFGAGPLIVTPGIRSADEAVGDQKRVATAADAVKAGASHIVVGRPVLAAADPLAAAGSIRKQLESAAG